MLWFLTMTAQAGTCEDWVQQLELAMEEPGHCGTRAIFGVQQAARAAGASSCLEPALRGFQIPVAPALRGASEGYRGGLDTRDIYGDDESYETEHFVIRWEEYTGFNDNDVEALGDALEYIWSIEVDEIGFRAPESTDTYKFNVYIGDTGGELSAYGNGGWYNRDDQGYPMLVVMNEIGDHEYAADVVAHEFFHALQDEASSYQYYDQGAWYWEATAMWAESEVSPGPAYAAFYAGWAMRPELPVNFFRYADGTIEGYHQYGASIFPRHLTENVTDREIIRRSWEEAPFEGDPMEELDALLEEMEGTGVEEQYIEMVGRIATYDFQYGEEMEEVLGWWEDSFESHQMEGSLDVGEVPVDAEYELYTYGAGFWRLEDTSDGVTIEVNGEEGPQWYGIVATRDGSTHTRTLLEFDGNEGTLSLEGLGSVDEAWLVVAAIDDFEGGDHWGYSVYALSSGDPDDTNEDTEDSGEEGDKLLACGCATPGMAGAWLGMPIAGLLLRRRQRSHRAASAA